MFQPKHLLIAIILRVLSSPLFPGQITLMISSNIGRQSTPPMRGHIGAISRIVRAGLGDYKGHITDHATAIQNAAEVIPAMFPEGSDAMILMPWRAFGQISRALKKLPNSW